MKSMLVVATINGSREVVFALSALACLVVGGMLVWLIVLTRNHRPDWTGRRRAMWALGALVGSLITLAGVGFVAAWAAGADWNLSSSSSSSSQADFCSTHDCIPNFDNGNGSIVQCADGSWSHSGGIQGACSDHGGEG
jgi:hypothetical protein